MANKKRIKRGEPPKAAKNVDIKSPRTAEAWRRQGYEPEELKYLTFEEFKATIKDPKVTLPMMKIRYGAYEEYRREKVRFPDTNSYSSQNYKNNLPSPPPYPTHHLQIKWEKYIFRNFYGIFA